jgi:mRNA interferase MazF
MKRGDVWWISFPAAVGGEIQKERPAIIVSNDVANRLLNRVQVVPLTSNVDRLYPSEAYVMVNNTQHKAMADQITTISKKRITNQMGTVSQSDMQAVERAIKVQLGLP